MKLSFWIKFAIQEAVIVTETLVSNTKLTDAQKLLVTKFIEAGQNLLGAF